MMPTPMEQAYTELQHAYNVFNAQLFDRQLPPCHITMQHKNRTYGYVAGERWHNLAGTVTDEIAMNPMHCATRSAEGILSTLAHEMMHLWQHHCSSIQHNRVHAHWEQSPGQAYSWLGCAQHVQPGKPRADHVRGTCDQA